MPRLATLSAHAKGLALCACLAFVAPSAAGFSDADGRFAVKGAGNMACSEFQETLGEKSVQFGVYAGWVAGYVTGLNQAETETYDLMGWHSVTSLLLAVDAYCSRVEDRPFHQAVGQVVALMGNDRLTAFSPSVTLGEGGEAVSVYAETVRRIKQKLKQRGFYDGAVNTEYDAATSEAIKAVQEQAQLRPTGLPDQPTLTALFLVD
ncbi:putative peptidoglycan binding protein [Rhodothalassium salexigens DSM 2132]|uniref:Putative peptidoglycan binding protein n=1 Tax=Rhodothalassium salexigens DSM 2132 TaxID=1188247 RepID=A0A4R2PR26_RHOSA|nr:peptidoglycan-binding domain-containing protein [Rhodothalassium salexigens]MBB4210105.1 hypothetical protein [Rhodothalassium salexigens DSM 2132]MBK1638429.1 hypothetical protein [Rhodothalassium salexigens DSM 2132]TCP38270.1 putative peptidoglycan binding protein [Rhodothalassium salexigens DSM 2132]